MREKKKTTGRWLKEIHEAIAAFSSFQNWGTHLPSKPGTAQKELSIKTTLLCSSVYVCMPSSCKIEFLQQRSKCDSPTGLGLHIKYLGNMNPKVREAKSHQGARAAQHFTRSGSHAACPAADSQHGIQSSQT